MGTALDCQASGAALTGQRGRLGPTLGREERERERGSETEAGRALAKCKVHALNEVVRNADKQSTGKV